MSDRRQRIREAASVPGVILPAGGGGATDRIDGFESHSNGDTPDGWNISTQGGGSVDNTRASAGSLSYNNTSDPAADNYYMLTDTLSLSPTTIQFDYWEPQASGGNGFRPINANGDEIMVVGTANPQAVYTDNGSGTGLVDSPSPNYEEWRRWEVTFDWANNQYDATWTDLTGSTSPSQQSVSGAGFTNNSSEIQKIGCGDFYGMTANGNEWVDEIWGVKDE